MKRFPWFVPALFVVVANSGCKPGQTPSPAPAPPANKATTPADAALRMDVLSVTPRSGNYVEVAFRVTNAGAQTVVRAKATITVLDANGAKIGSESHYVVKSAAGGLAPGNATEGDFLIRVNDPKKAANARFKLEFVRGG